MKSVDHANQALTFFIELAVYAAVVAWALSSSFSTATKTLIAIVGVAVMAVAWGLFAAPKASMPVHGVARIAFEVAWFGVGVAALSASGLRQWGIALAIVFVANGVLRVALA